MNVICEMIYECEMIHITMRDMIHPHVCVIIHTHKKINKSYSHVCEVIRISMRDTIHTHVCVIIQFHIRNRSRRR